ncbi:MAG: cytochrome c biogenesis protein CcdA [Thermodesulfovibrionia bacterium]|nr:MAG: cytochrome c biogenesis protein CcdA [Thermodesulfovibrionia bacterium]
METISLPLVFLAGVVSFLSPCVLPLIPSYISYISGVTFEDLTSGQDSKKIKLITLVNSVLFVLGFSFVFIALGASTSFLGSILFQYQDWMRIIGGVIVIIFGLFIAGFLDIGFLMKEKKFMVQGKPSGFAGSFLIGVTFGAGWTPCIGPILGSILIAASSAGSVAGGMELLSVYSAGLAIPFLLSALLFNSFLNYFKILLKYMNLIKLIGGIIIIIFGFVLITNKLGILAGWFPNIGLTI